MKGRAFCRHVCSMYTHARRPTCAVGMPSQADKCNAGPSRRPEPLACLHRACLHILPETAATHAHSSIAGGGPGRGRDAGLVGSAVACVSAHAQVPRIFVSPAGAPALGVSRQRKNFLYDALWG